MSEFARTLPLFVNFRHSGFESSAQNLLELTNLLEERELENPQKLAKMDEMNTVEIGKTSPSTAKGSSSLHDAPVRAESIMERL